MNCVEQFMGPSVHQAKLGLDLAPTELALAALVLVRGVMVSGLEVLELVQEVLVLDLEAMEAEVVVLEVPLELGVLETEV